MFTVTFGLAQYVPLSVVGTEAQRCGGPVEVDFRLPLDVVTEDDSTSWPTH